MIRNALIAGCLAAAGMAAPADRVSDRIDRNAKVAEVIVIGKVEETGIRYNADYPAFRAARLRVESVVKGKLEEREILVPYAYSSPELSFDCCELGGRYLFMVTYTGSPGVYIVPDGKFGGFTLGDLGDYRASSR